MFLEVIKKAFEKVKYKFKGNDNREYVIEDKGETDYLPKEEELAQVDLAPGEVLVLKVSINKEQVRRAAEAIDKYFECIRLTKILIKTRKPRVKKKLAKRIARLKSYKC